MNDGKAFFDTNILLYMYGGDPDKQRRAKQLFEQYTAQGSMLVSTQVVQEFYVAGSRKLGIPKNELQEATSALLDLPLVTVGPFHIKAAQNNELLFKLSFWDALILAAAQSGGAGVLYTEDFNDGQQYGPVVAWNPFR